MSDVITKGVAVKSEGMGERIVKCAERDIVLIEKCEEYIRANADFILAKKSRDDMEVGTLECTQALDDPKMLAAIKKEERLSYEKEQLAVEILDKKELLDNSVISMEASYSNDDNVYITYADGREEVVKKSEKERQEAEFKLNKIEAKIKELVTGRVVFLREQVTEFALEISKNVKEVPELKTFEQQHNFLCAQADVVFTEKNHNFLQKNMERISGSSAAEENYKTKLENSFSQYQFREKRYEKKWRQLQSQIDDINEPQLVVKKVKEIKQFIRDVAKRADMAVYFANSSED